MNKLRSFSGKNIKGFFFYMTARGDQVSLMRGNVQPVLFLILTAHCLKAHVEPSTTETSGLSIYKHGP